MIVLTRSIINYPVSIFSIAGLNSEIITKSSWPCVYRSLNISFNFLFLNPITGFGSLTPLANSAFITLRSRQVAENFPFSFF